MVDITSLLKHDDIGKRLHTKRAFSIIAYALDNIILSKVNVLECFGGNTAGDSLIHTIYMRNNFNLMLKLYKCAPELLYIQNRFGATPLHAFIVNIYCNRTVDIQRHINFLMTISSDIYHILYIHMVHSFKDIYSH